MTGIDPSGCIVLDKREGITSFQALGALKRALGTKKIGHTGTLDKFASGVLVVFSGVYTRLVPYFSDGGKTYETVFEFGTTTDTLDPEGDVVSRAPVPTHEAILEALPAFSGTIMQSPPVYSAVHVDGKRAYERTLSGETLELKPRPISIASFEFLEWKPPYGTFRVSCSKGTYIRSLARDLGTAVGSVAYVKSLRRTRNDPFCERDAIAADLFDPALHKRPITPALAALAGHASVEIADVALGPFSSGVQPRPEWFSAPIGTAPVFVFSGTGRLVGIVRSGERGIHYETVFNGLA